MMLEDIVERVGKLRSEVGRLAEEFDRTTGKFDERVKQLVSRELRIQLVREIEGLIGKTLREARRRKREEESYRRICPMYEVHAILIQAIMVRLDDTVDFSFSHLELDRWQAERIAREMEEEHDDVRYTELEELEERIKTLKSLILKGKLDQILKMKAGEVLWEIMGRKGKLIPYVERYTNRSRWVVAKPATYTVWWSRPFFTGVGL